MAGETPKSEAKVLQPGTRPRLRYEDRPEIMETFADSIRTCVMDGQNLRIEFTVSRFDEPKLPGQLEGRRLPVCRLVLTPAAVLDLFNRMQQVANALKAGKDKAAAAGPVARK